MNSEVGTPLPDDAEVDGTATIVPSGEPFKEYAWTGSFCFGRLLAAVAAVDDFAGKCRVDAEVEVEGDNMRRREADDGIGLTCFG